MHAEGPHPTSRPRWKGISGIARCSSARTRGRAVNEGRAEFIPVFLSDIPQLFDSRPDSARRRVHQRDPARRARLLLAGPVRRRHADGRPLAPRSVIAQVNKRMAPDAGQQLPPRERDRSRDRGRPAAVRPTRIGEPGEIERRIGRVRRRPHPGRSHAPDGHRRHPERRRRLRSATSGTSASTPRCSPTLLVDLVEAGVVTCDRKELDRGKIVAAFMMGTQRLYDFVDDNPMVEMRRSTTRTTRPSSAASGACAPSTRPSRST